MKSMTGFGTAELNQSGLNIKVVARALNDKYISVKCKIPPEFPEYISYKIERMIPQLLRRGSIFINISIVDKRERFPTLVVKYNLLGKYVDLLKEIIKKYNLHSDITISDILQLGNIFESPTNDYESADFEEMILGLVEKAILQLNEMRNKEGDDLEEFFITSINKMEVSLSTIELSVPNCLEELKIKTKSRIENLLKEGSSGAIYLGKNNFKQEKLSTEVSYFIEKSDITEEIVRLKSHLKKLRELISTKDEPIGLSLGFVLLEMQREVVTISAKYNYIPIFPDVLKIKEEIEKCKEQALNVE
jgi:uncharacterized protein (TIGR00255 family)